MESTPQDALRNLEVTALNYEGLAHEFRKQEVSARLQAESYETKAANCRELMRGIILSKSATIEP